MGELRDFRSSPPPSLLLECLSSLDLPSDFPQLYSTLPPSHYFTSGCIFISCIYSTGPPEDVAMPCLHRLPRTHSVGP